ncbi:Arc family DNA-binding protein [Humitalea sp. 24SJ18S-53]|uniref:Arc family DNA-binding protein n=1 Tax=Humitalea sp. 24SJ18S-53 TaxID=3422307 RepID=UPI003D6778B4
METEPQMMRVRISPTLKAWLREQAKQNCRTMNSEITFRLEMARMGIQQKGRETGAPAAGEALQA